MQFDDCSGLGCGVPVFNAQCAALCRLNVQCVHAPPIDAHAEQQPVGVVTPLGWSIVPPTKHAPFTTLNGHLDAGCTPGGALGEETAPPAPHATMQNACAAARVFHCTMNYPKNIWPITQMWVAYMYR